MKVLSALLLLSPALIAEPAQAVLDDMAQALARATAVSGKAQCELGKPEIRPHRAHGKLPLGYIRHLVLSNGTTTYSLRYWMNIADATATTGTAIEGSSGLGMDRPNSVNWYNNNFFEFSYGGKQILKDAMARMEVMQGSGERASGRFVWDVPEAKVTLEVGLEADGDALELRCQVEAKGKPKPVRLGFRAYPGHAPPPRARRVITRVRELRPPLECSLGKEEGTVVLFDEAEPHLPCAIRWEESGCAGANLVLHEYGVTINLDFAVAESFQGGRILLWDFRGRSLNAVLDRLLESSGKARATLR